jgi:hypothetical protein
MGIITTLTGIKRYLHECKRYERVHQVIAFSAKIEQNGDLPVVTDDEKEQADQNIQSIKTIHPEEAKESIQPEGVKEQERSTPLQVGFEEKQHDIVDRHPTFLDDMQEYMHWHCRLNHASHIVMIKLANKKMLPQRITKILKKMGKQ